MTAKTIGQINGPWSILLRLALATYPLVLGWSIWMTTQQFQDKHFREAGPRYTATEAALANERMKAELMLVISQLPSPMWQQRIVEIETLARSNDAKLTRLIVLVEETK